MRMTLQTEPPGTTRIVATLAPSRTRQMLRYVRRFGLQFGIIGVMVIMWVFLMITAPDTFLRKEIYISLADSVPYYGIMALPIALLIIAREIDLSFGSIMAVGVMCFLAVFNATGSPILGLAGCLLAGLGAGLLNGLIVVKVGIPSLIATIGMQFFWRGLVLVLTQVASNYPLEPAAQADPFLRDLLVGRIFGVIPAQFIWMIIIAVATWILLNRHRFGAHTY